MSSLDAQEARERFVRARVARLATIDPGETSAGGEGRRPHVVPLVFVVEGDTLFSAVDAKPKRTQALRRLANVEADPRVSLLVDEYDDKDWTALWWARADGSAVVLPPDHERARAAVRLLMAKYPQHAEQPPAGPVLAVEVERWSGWSYV